MPSFCLSSFGQYTASTRLRNSGSLLSTSTNSSPRKPCVVVTADLSLCLQSRYSHSWLVERFRCQNKLCLGCICVPKMLGLQITFPSCVAFLKISAVRHIAQKRDG